MFSPAEAIAYVSGLLDGNAPAPLVAVATKELAEPLDSVCAVKTILSGAAIRAGRSLHG
ncbi:hypothetical protein ACFV5G_18370 [Streptomyces sp. NPDC059766]|uniref:hypothetical protein n=1 Tax=Streptomyces sp. NPDC059766 TaxID=3346940 RepID=UPI00364D6613